MTGLLPGATSQPVTYQLFNLQSDAIGTFLIIRVCIRLPSFDTPPSCRDPGAHTGVATLHACFGESQLDASDRLCLSEEREPDQAGSDDGGPCWQLPLHLGDEDGDRQCQSGR